MLRSFAGLFVLALIWSVSGIAQELPKLGPPIKTINKPMNTQKDMKPKIVDINSAPEADIVAVGIEKAVAKKIVEGRPYRNKRELLSRELLTKEQYEKLKDLLVAKQPPKK